MVLAKPMQSGSSRSTCLPIWAGLAPQTLNPQPYNPKKGGGGGHGFRRGHSITKVRIAETMVCAASSVGKLTAM